MADDGSPGPPELLLLATEQRVLAFNLSQRSQVTIGRHESNDVQLESRAASNFHAEIVCEPDGIVVRDLGSTNGTFVNERRVEVHTLVTGDRLRIGNHVITLDIKFRDGPIRAALAEPEPSQLLDPGSRGRIISVRGRATNAAKTMQGTDPEITFPELLKLSVFHPQSLRIVLTRARESARIWTRKRKIVHAQHETAVGEKALYRIFSWESGSYEIEALEPNDGLRQTIDLPLNTLVTEGLAHATELGTLAARLPPCEAALRLREDCVLTITAYSPAEFEMFQLIVRHKTIASVLEASALADVRVLRTIESLIEKGVFELAGIDGELEGTLFPPLPGKTA